MRHWVILAHQWWQVIQSKCYRVGAYSLHFFPIFKSPLLIVWLLTTWILPVLVKSPIYWFYTRCWSYWRLRNNLWHHELLRWNLHSKKLNHTLFFCELLISCSSEVKFEKNCWLWIWTGLIKPFLALRFLRYRWETSIGDANKWSRFCLDGSDNLLVLAWSCARDLPLLGLTSPTNFINGSFKSGNSGVLWISWISI